MDDGGDEAVEAAMAVAEAALQQGGQPAGAAMTGVSPAVAEALLVRRSQCHNTTKHVLVVCSGASSTKAGHDKTASRSSRSEHKVIACKACTV